MLTKKSHKWLPEALQSVICIGFPIHGYGISETIDIDRVSI